MTKNIRSAIVLGAILGLSCITFLACDDSSSAVKEPSPDSGGAITPDSGGTNSQADGSIPFDAGTLPDGAPKDCFDNPTTHFEIINGCTTATKITKNPTLTKLLPDGGLPALN